MDEKRYLSFFQVSNMLPPLACIFSNQYIHLLVYENNWKEEWIQEFRVSSEFSRLPSLSVVKTQLSEYLLKKRKSFDLALYEHTKDFNLKAARYLENLPYGQTTSYQQLASMMGNPKAARAVGNAMNRNQHVIVRACHRVIKQNGQVGNYAAGAETKAFLLDLERIT